jgi:hypothetical protein
MSIPTVIPTPAATATDPLDIGIETARVGAIMRLAFARKQYPELIRAEAATRVNLAAAIMTMDESDDLPGRHNLHEQMAVEVATRAYGQALADLIRGEAS